MEAKFTASLLAIDLMDEQNRLSLFSRRLALALSVCCTASSGIASEPQNRTAAKQASRTSLGQLLSRGWGVRLPQPPADETETATQPNVQQRPSVVRPRARRMVADRDDKVVESRDVIQPRSKAPSPSVPTPTNFAAGKLTKADPPSLGSMAEFIRKDNDLTPRRSSSNDASLSAAVPSSSRSFDSEAIESLPSIPSAALLGVPRPETATNTAGKFSATKNDALDSSDAQANGGSLAAIFRSGDERLVFPMKGSISANVASARSNGEIASEQDFDAPNRMPVPTQPLTGEGRNERGALGRHSPNVSDTSNERDLSKQHEQVRNALSGTVPRIPIVTKRNPVPQLAEVPPRILRAPEVVTNSRQLADVTSETERRTVATPPAFVVEPRGSMADVPFGLPAPPPDVDQVPRESVSRSVPLPTIVRPTRRTLNSSNGMTHRR